MTRIKSFAAPHKGLRNVIAKFSFQFGHTDFKDPEALKLLKLLGSEMFTLLNDHVHTENEYTLKCLEERVPGSSVHDKDEHERLEAIQRSLEERIAAFTGDESPDDIHACYLHFTMFQSEYLAHVHEEETVTELLLQQYFSDEELTQHRITIMQNIQFPVLLLWLKYIIPAQSEDESVQMLSGFRQKAPAEAFEQVLAAVKMEMEATRYKKIIAKLN